MRLRRPSARGPASEPAPRTTAQDESSNGSVQRCRWLEIRVKPNAGASALHPRESGIWQADLKSSPVDGKANAELVALVAKHFGCSRAAVAIKAGATARTKLIKVDGA